MQRAPTPILAALLMIVIGLSLGAPAAPANAASTIVHTSAADLLSCGGGGPALSGTSVIEEGDGEISLRAGLEDHFRGPAVDTGVWTSGAYAGAPGISQPGGELRISSTASNSGFVRSIQPFHYGTLEGVVTFGGGEYQHFGFSVPGGLENADPIAIFSSGDDAQHLYVRVTNGYMEQRVQVPGTTGSGTYRLKIVWADAGASAPGSDILTFFVDGAQVASFTLTAPAVGLPRFPVSYVYLANKPTSLGSYVLRADWMRVTPYSGASGTYLSCPLAASVGERQRWGAVTYAATLNGQAPPLVEVRTSDDGLSWSPFAAVASGATPAVPAGVFAQYRVSLSTADLARSPLLTQISLSYSYDSTLGPVVTPGSAGAGSLFLVRGDSGTGGANLAVRVNARLLGTMPAQPDGQFAFYLDTRGMQPGTYTVSVTGGSKQLQLPFTIDGSTTLSPVSPGGSVTFHVLQLVLMPMARR